MKWRGIGMVNQQKGVQQDTAYSAVVVNDHMYPRPYIVFDPKGVIETWKNDIGMDGDTYDHSLQLHYRQYLVALLFADLPSLSPFISWNDFYTCIHKTVCVCVNHVRNWNIAEWASLVVQMNSCIVDCQKICRTNSSAFSISRRRFLERERG